jgi:putative phosphoesterase
MKLGVLSDTHGHIHPHIHTLFQKVDAIIHAGDIGNDDILIELETIAPVTAVRGNMDKIGRPAAFNEFVIAAFDGITCFITHDLGAPPTLKKHFHPIIERYLPQVIIFGHTHKPYSRRIGDVLYFNPGSATSGRSVHNQTVGIISITKGRLTHSIVHLQ